MSFDKTGVLLEEVRLGNANDQFNFPPNNSVTNQSEFDAVSARSEYNILAGSTDLSVKGTDIGDSTLIFYWSRNQGSVKRFDYDSYAQKWLPSPGSTPDLLGSLSNSSRLTAPIPDLDVGDAPYSLFLGATTRILTFSIQIVGTELDFTDPAIGVVQLALDSGLLNFNSTDVVSFGGQDVFSQRQSSFDRIRFTGRIGQLPLSSSIDYFFHLNPLPNSGQIPRVRIDYQRHLTPVQVTDETGLTGIASGTFHWALDTGRIKLSDNDINNNAGKAVYYDGIHNDSFQLERIDLGSLTTGFPGAGFTNSNLIGISDSVEYLVFAESGNTRSYFPAQLFSSIPSSAPVKNNCYINTTNGQILFNSSDVSTFSGFTFHLVRTRFEIDEGVSIQFFRSSVNTSGESIVDDFTIIYFVEDQIISDGIGQFPFTILPTVPVIDSELEYVISQGPSSSGTFTGVLNDATDPEQSGFGYTLNLDQKQLSYSNRKTSTITVQKTSPFVKFDDGIINPLGLEVEKNGIPITAGIDFVFNETTGEMKFLQSVGGNDPDAKSNVSGTVTLPNIFEADDPFDVDEDDAGKVILVNSGNNQGVYDIINHSDFTEQTLVTPDFVESGEVIIDIKSEAEIIANNFWEILNHSYRKFTLSVSTSIDGSFSDLENSEYEVFSSNGQVNLRTPASIGSVYKVSYSYFVTQPDGTQTSVSTTEFSLFKIRQEIATVSVGSNEISFNPEGKDVSTARDIEVYVNGVTQPAGTFEFVAPGTIFLRDPVSAGQSVIIDYWVNNSLGGETNFRLLNGLIDIDKIQISSGSTSLVLNGDFSSLVFVNSAILTDTSGEVILVTSVDYNSSDDITTLGFKAALFSTSNSETFKYSSKQFTFTTESATADLILSNASQIRLVGDVSGYSSGIIITIDGDPFLVTSRAYDAIANRTVLTLGVVVKDNHLSPVIERSERPVFFPGKTFQTSLPASIDEEFVLILMGDTRKILVRDVDYTVLNGGFITLSSDIGGTDVLRCIYVADDFQEVGTTFEINYSYTIVPDDINGIAGQRLSSSYNLFSPDSYFYRIETVETFLPEVQDFLRQSAQSTGVSGPNTNDAIGRSNKDEGSPGLYYPEQHLENLDFSINRLLLFYNNIINLYEDLLSNLDGRIVGGQHGRFRYDGNSNNSPRDSFDDITNDLDDRVKLYDKKVLTGFFTFENIPVYVSMAEPNSISRIYPLKSDLTTAINDLVGEANFGEILGTIGIEDLTDTGNFSSTLPTALVNGSVISGASTVLTIDSNGNVDNLIPEFEIGHDVTVYTNEGTVAGSATITAVSPTSLTVDAAISVLYGTVSRDPADAALRTYVTNFDIRVSFDTGEISNITLSVLPQQAIVGDELLDISVQFNNPETTPRRIPVLDGSTFNDYGFLPVPQLRRFAESVILDKELDHLSNLETASFANPDVLTTTLSLVVGDNIRFLSGLNAGEVREVIVDLGSNDYQMDSAYSNVVLNDDIERILADGTRLNDTLNEEIGVIRDNTSGTGVGLIENIDSELITVDSLIRCLGTEISSGSGAATSTTTFFDGSANFSLDGVSDQSYLYISDGTNYGLYDISSATSNTITINDSNEFGSFPSSSASGSYFIFDLESFLTSNGLEFISAFLRGTLSFLSETLAWQASPTFAGVAGRTIEISTRQTNLLTFISDLENILQRSDKLYDVRYLWIQQRADRKEGLLTLTNQAIAKREEDIQKLIADQTKLLITQNL